MDRIIVKRANVVLEVLPEEKDYYMSLGYSVLDKSGKVIEESLPTDVNALQIMVAKLQKENAELKEKLNSTGNEVTAPKKRNTSKQ